MPLPRRQSHPILIGLVVALAVTLVACMPATSRDRTRPAEAMAAVATPAAERAEGEAEAGTDLDSYALDPVHTRVMLAIDHAGFSRAIGTVSGTTGSLRFAAGDWSGASVIAEVPLSRLDFGDADWNRAVAARGLLDSERHPVARFASTRIERVDDRRARIHGTLTLRGVSREVVLDATLNGHRRHPLPPFRRTVGFSATTTLSRADFGSTAWGSVIGDDVELRIELEAVRARDEPAPQPTTDMPANQDTTPP